MNTLKKIAGTLLIGVAVSVAGVFTSPVDTYAHDGEDHSAQEFKTKTADEKIYSYTANAGDSYTQLVRKAVQTYGILHKEDLGTARIVSIETTASKQAGWPLLAEGQVVSFGESTIKTWVNQAMKLSDADVAAWATYAPYINFDTRDIGE